MDILKYYEDRAIRAEVFVDANSSDRTLDTCRRHGYHRIETIRNRTGRVETLIEELSERASNDWILRIDDDEIPSDALLHFAQSVITGDAKGVFGFRRLQCGLSKSGLWAAGIFDSPDHVQWRLYNRRSVGFDDTLHSAGITLNTQTFAPSEATLLHLDWIVHSYEERCRKIQSYDQQAENAGTRWRDFYLVEDNAADIASFPLKDGEFKRLRKRLFKAFGPVPRRPAR